MILMTEDFPIYSPSVIGRAERKGQTMLRFWQGQIVPEFRCLPCGKCFGEMTANVTGILRTVAIKSQNVQEKLFQASYLLTLLMLYAAFGGISYPCGIVYHIAPGQLFSSVPLPVFSGYYRF